MNTSLAQFRRFINVRLTTPSKSNFLAYVEKEVLPQTFLQDLLIPEEMTLGYYTEYYQELTEEEKLALNHWIYFLHYYRIRNGERFVVQSNNAVGRFVQKDAPEVTQLLALENKEEEDHIAAFSQVLEHIAEHYQFQHLSIPEKPAQQLIRSRRVLDFTAKFFGVDYVIAYFLGRGIINHMGQAFESDIGRLKTTNAQVHKLSFFHTVDESKHMAFSHYMTNVARDVLPKAFSRPVYPLLHYFLRRFLVIYTFSDEITKKQEKAMSLKILPQLAPLKQRSHTFLNQLVEAHFKSLSGVERSKNAKIGKQNQKILAESALSLPHKKQWKKWMETYAGNLQFFPEEENIESD